MSSRGASGLTFKFWTWLKWGWGCECHLGAQTGVSWAAPTFAHPEVERLRGSGAEAGPSQGVRPPLAGLGVEKGTPGFVSLGGKQVAKPERVTASPEQQVLPPQEVPHPRRTPSRRPRRDLLAPQRRAVPQHP